MSVKKEFKEVITDHLFREESEMTPFGVECLEENRSVFLSRLSNLNDEIACSRTRRGEINPDRIKGIVEAAMSLISSLPTVEGGFIPE